MGIDIRKHHVRKSQRTTTLSKNPYRHMLIKLYKYLGRKVRSGFNQEVLKRLVKSKTFRPVISLSKLVKHMDGKKDKIAVVVATVTDDIRITEVPQLNIAALRFTETARKRIVSGGGVCMTFDELAMRAPTGSNTILLRGSRRREAAKHFGAVPGAKGSKAKPYTRSKGRKFERARGKGRSRT